MSKYLLLALLVSALVFGSCGDEEIEAPAFNYEVTIVSPDAANKVAGDMIHIHVNFDETDLNIVHNVNVTLVDDNENVIYEFKEHVHDETGHFELHADVLLDVEPDTDLTIWASVWSDALSIGEGAHDHDEEPGAHGEEEEEHEEMEDEHEEEEHEKEEGEHEEEEEGEHAEDDADIQTVSLQFHVD